MENTLRTNRKAWLYVIFYILGELASGAFAKKLFSSSLFSFLNPTTYVKLIVYALIAIICWVYCFVVFWNMVKDMNRLCEELDSDASIPSSNWLIVCLLSVITLGIYQLYWAYKQGKRLQECSQKYDSNISVSGSFLLILWIFGIFTFGITRLIGICFWISNLNAVSESYNSAHSIGNEPNDSDEMVSEAPYPQAPLQGQDLPTEREWNVHIEEQNPTRQEISGTVVGMNGIYRNVEFPIADKEEIIIGRDSNLAHIIVKDGNVSRKHCGICFDQEHRCYYVMDYSSNGTFDGNGAPIPSKTWNRYNPGTMISLGKDGARFVLL